MNDGLQKWGNVKGLSNQGSQLQACNSDILSSVFDKPV
jgi:hypothetical protein